VGVLQKVVDNHDLQPWLNEQRSSANKEHKPTMFQALEFFPGLTPEQLSRMVKPSQLEDATLAHPNAKTSFSPLCCVAFTKSESKLPWFSVDDSGKLKVNGVSLFRPLLRMNRHGHTTLRPLRSMILE
jgi:hypothetical protein